jgi:hypothetical protein
MQYILINSKELKPCFIFIILSSLLFSEEFTSCKMYIEEKFFLSKAIYPHNRPWKPIGL